MTLARAEDGTPACFVSQVEDLTDRHLAAESEQRAHPAFAALVDVMPDAVVGLDPDDRITLFNRAAEQLWGRRASEVLGTAGTVLLPERQHPAHRARLVRLATSAVTANRSPSGADAARPALLSPALHGDGHEFPVEIFVAVTDHDGRQAFTAVVRPGAEAVTP